MTYYKSYQNLAKLSSRVLKYTYTPVGTFYTKAFNVAKELMHRALDIWTDTWAPIVYGYQGNTYNDGGSR